MSDEAKAIGEIAKTAGKAIDVGSRAGNSLSELCGPLLADAVGIVHDRVRFLRLKYALDLQEKWHIELEKRGVTQKQPVPLAIAIRALDLKQAFPPRHFSRAGGRREARSG